MHIGGEEGYCLMFNVMIVDDFRVFITQLRRLDVWKRYSDTFDLKYMLTDSRQALDILRREHVDVLITDIKMPKLSGLDLLRYAVEEKLCRCTVLLSEYTDFEYAHEAIILGAFDYIVKPVSDTMMTRILDRAAKFLSENPDNRDDDADIKTASDALCDSIINGYDNYSERVHELAAACGRKSGENLMRFGIILGDASETVFNKLSEAYGWIKNIVDSPERLRAALLRADSREAAESLFTGFCNDLFVAVRTYYPRGLSDLTRGIADYILANYSQKLTLSDVADACFVNKTHLSHIFKMNMGISFVDYIVRYKMQMLRLMIAQTDMTVNEIADKLGYDDCKYMSRLFKNTYGITVSEYRKSVLNDRYR